MFLSLTLNHYPQKRTTRRAKRAERAKVKTEPLEEPPLLLLPLPPLVAGVGQVKVQLELVQAAQRLVEVEGE